MRTGEKISLNRKKKLASRLCFAYAAMVESVDTRDLKSLGQ